MKYFYRYIFAIFCLFILKPFPLNGQGINKERFYRRQSVPASEYRLFSTFGEPDSLPLIKDDFRVNEISPGCGSEQARVNVAMDSNGYYAAAWVDKRSGQEEIYIRFFNDTNEPVTDNIVISEKPNFWNSAPAVACNPNGDYVVAWAQSSEEILAQRINIYGEKIGSNFKVNAKRGYNAHHPSIAVKQNGDFLIAWSQKNSSYGINHLYARLFDKSGQAKTEQMLIDDTDSLRLTGTGFGNMIAIDKKDNFVIAWSAHNNSRFKIYLRNLTPDGQKEDAIIPVSDPNDQKYAYLKAVRGTDDGHVFILWECSGLKGRIWHRDGYFITDPFYILEPTSYFGYWGNITADRKNNTFVTIWSNYSSIQSRKISGDGTFLGDIVTLQTYYGDLIGFKGQMSNIIDYHFVIALEKNKKLDRNVVLQKYDINYNPVTELIDPSDDSLSAAQNEPAVFFNEDGYVLVLWTDRRNGREDLYAQIYDPYFEPVGNNIKINDGEPGLWFLKNKSVKTFSDGTFLVAFSASEHADESNIYLQKIDRQGQKIGANKLVAENHYQYAVKTGIDKNDQVLVCWYDIDNGMDNAYLKKLDKDFHTIKPAKRFIKFNGKYTRRPFDLSINEDLQIFTIWSKSNQQGALLEHHIYGLLYNQFGEPVSDSMLVASFGPHDRFYSVSGQYDINGNYIVCVYKNYKVYIKRHYEKEYSFTIENSFPSNYYRSYYPQPQIVLFRNRKAYVTWINNNLLFGSYFNDNIQTAILHRLHRFSFPALPIDIEISNGAAIHGNRLFFTFTKHSQNESGYDVWANVKDLQDISFDKEVLRPPVKADVLYPSYPNPFNATTTIPYKVFAYHKVRIAIYNTLGQLVRVLVDRYHEKGFYEVEFDASALASGLYFCRMEAFDTQVQKLLLIK